VYSTHHWTYITGPEFQRRFPAARRRHVGSAIVFRIPLFRDMMLWGGVIDADAKVAAAVLAEGFTLVTLTGGIAEQTRASPGTHHAIVTPRKGIFESLFCILTPFTFVFAAQRPSHVSLLPYPVAGIFKLSLQHGVPIIPAYCFGETDSVSTLPWLAGLRARLSDRFRLPLCLSWGRWGTPLPHRVPFTAVFGAPLEVTKPVAQYVIC
jgi:2-acylglycerol O-acyltransferase 2